MMEFLFEMAEGESMRTWILIVALLLVGDATAEVAQRATRSDMCGPLDSVLLGGRYLYLRADAPAVRPDPSLDD